MSSTTISTKLNDRRLTRTAAVASSPGVLSSPGWDMLAGRELVKTRSTRVKLKRVRWLP